MDSMKFRMDKKGVSEVIGTVLLLAIAISAFSVLAVYVFSNNGTTPIPHVNLVGYMDKNYNAIIEHQGGDSLKLQNIRVIIWLGEVKSNEFTFPKSMLQNYNHSIFFPSKGNSMFYDAGNNKRWDVGDYIKIDCPSIFSDITQNISHWQISVTVIDKASNSIIMSGILQQGILHTVPPVAIFTYEPLNPKVGRGVIFNASASYDPDGGDIVQYKWDFDGDGIIDATTTNPVTNPYKYQKARRYNVTLTVIDDEGEQTSVTTGIGVGADIPPVNVTVNKPPVAYFINVTQKDGWVYFDASASYDPDGNVVEYIWEFGDGNKQVKLYDPTIKWKYSKGGANYTVKLTVVDEDGTKSTTVTSISLYGEPLHVPPIPPVAIIKTPADVSTASDAFFSGIDSYDPDGDDLVNFSWDFDGDGNPDAYGVNVTYHFYQVGNYTINLTVVDSSGGVGYASRTIYVRAPIAAKKFLIVDNTPVYIQNGGLHPYRKHNWEGISNIINSLNIGDVYDYGKAIDDSYFYAYHNETGWHNSTINPNGPYDPVNINDTIMAKYDIVIWSTGDYPGDGKWFSSQRKPDNPYLPNAWTTPMTEGVDDYANHMQELKNLMAKGGVFLLTGTYAVRDLQNYWGNWASPDEIAFGKELGLKEPKGGIDENLHTYNTIAYFASDTYNPHIQLPYYYRYFRYGPIYVQGVLRGVKNTSSGGVNLTIEQPMPIYSLMRRNSNEFIYSLYSSGGQTFLKENFSGGFPPSGWMQEEAGEWKKINSHEAGGNSPEAKLRYKWINGNHAYLITKPVNTTSASVLSLEFRSDIDIRHSGYPFNCYVYVRKDENDVWEDYTPWKNPITSDPLPSTYSIDISDKIGEATQVKFEFIGSTDGIQDWSIDDVVITSSSVPPGHYAIDAIRGQNRSVVVGFDLNNPAINNTDRERYIIDVVNWLAEAVGYPTKIYVDNDKPSSWYDDTHVGNIQDAINRVMVGGTIYVDGTTLPYTSFNVIKSVKIIGADIGHGYPIIKTNGEYAIKSSVDWVTIKNLKIESMGNLQKGIYLEGSSSATITNCEISGAKYGIYAALSNYLNIKNNKLFNNTYNIYMEKCIKGEIRNNLIHSADYGIYARNSPKISIKGNEIYRNHRGVHLDSLDSPTINNNLLYGNSIGIYAFSSNSIIIYTNNIFNSSQDIYLDQSTNAEIYENYIKNATQVGVFIVNYSNGGNIFGNIIEQNGDGVEITNSNYLTIYNNTIYGNADNIKIDRGNNNVIICNKLRNATYGAYLSFAISNQLYNNIILNCSYGIYSNTIMDSQIMRNIINESVNAITLYGSHPSKGNNLVTYNRIYNCDYGIILSSQSNENKVFNNTISNVNNWGISILSFSSTNNIENNSIVGTPYGIYVKSSSYNTISFNDIISPTVAIYLSSADNNKLLDNSIVANYYGIYIASGCNKNDIINSTIHNCLYGVYISSSYSTTISYNSITNSTDGILLENSDAETIINNTIANNTNGIHLISSGGSGNTIKFNRIYNNTRYGIILENSKASTAGNNEITGNNIHDNGEDGIYLYSSNINSISQNEIYNNGNNGICIYSSNSNPITMNEVHDNGNNGIYTNDSDSNTIDSNIIYNNAINGLYLSSSDGNRIGNNSISYNSIGMYLYASSEGDQYKIEGNEIWNNSIGIFLNASDSNYFGYDTANQIYNNTYGVYLTSSPGNHFVSNAIFNNSYGICILSSSNIEISKNYIENNTIGVYINSSSSNNIISQNNFIISTGYGVYINGSNCKNNLIYLNNFINTTAIIDSLGYDDGSGNNWYNVNSNDKEGNYWGNYNQTHPNATELPEDNPWHYSENYEIDGNAGSADIRPLINEVT